MKKFLLVVLVVSTCLPLLFAGGRQNSAGSAGSSGGLTTFKLWGWNREFTGRDGNTVLLSDWYNGTIPSRIWDETVAELARRGIKLDLELVMEDQTSTVFQTLMASGRFDNFDMIHSPVNLSSEVRYNLVNQKRIVALDQIINQYSDGTAKNFFATDFGRMSQGLINMPDGHMYWLPNIVDSWYKDKVKGDVGSAVTSMIRKDWLVPSTSPSQEPRKNSTIPCLPSGETILTKTASPMKWPPFRLAISTAVLTTGSAYPTMRIWADL
jgi:ABC-type glycerol-3-phosphate transport system substrate-binding protein